MDEIASTSALEDPTHHLLRAKHTLLQLLSSVDARPSRRKTPQSAAPIGACDECRKVKSKCDGIAPQTCTKCQASGKVCGYSVHGKRGRKTGPMSTATLLQSVFSEVEDALAGLAAGSATQSPPVGGVPIPTQEWRESEHSHPAVGVLIEESPLEVLARYSTLAPAATSLGPRVGDPAKSDTDPSGSLDPVVMGLLTESDMSRLLNLYFTRLRQFFWHLNPDTHTSAFFHSHSPLLLTSLLAVSAAFDPLSGHLLDPLAKHAVHLLDRVTKEGFKSVEIVTAISVMVHWASPHGPWSRDRSYAWLGMAIRIASELRLDRPLNRKSLEPITDEAYTALDHEAQRTWMLLYCSEISTSVQTGRPPALHGYAPIRGFSENAIPVVGSPDYQLHAVVFLRLIIVRALDTPISQAPGSREVFNRSWNAAMDSFALLYPDMNDFVKMIYHNNRIVLSLFSLRFPGPVQPVLDTCRGLCVTTCSIAINWPVDQDDPFDVAKFPLAYASNFAIINIAYGVTLLLKLIGMRKGDAEADESDLALCQQVANLFRAISSVQMHQKTLTEELAAQMDALIFNLRSWQTTQAPSPTLQPIDLPVGEYMFDCSELFNFEDYLVDQGTSDDFWLDGAAPIV